MSNTYFCFSDECGDYKANMSDKQKGRHPFYIRTSLLINAGEWKQLNRNFRELKERFQIPYAQEVKWAYLWSLMQYQKALKQIPDNHELKPFEKYDFHKLIEFVEQSLQLINKLNEKKIILTYTINLNSNNIKEQSLLGFHLQEHMQRLEMELQIKEDNLAVLFFDPVSNEKNEMFRQIYFDLFRNGDFIDKYKFLKDSLNIENSHQSVGIQIADYISGAFSALLKTDSTNSHIKGVKMFYQSVYPNLRRNRNGIIQGFGIREVPSSNLTRDWLTTKLDDFKINSR